MTKDCAADLITFNTRHLTGEAPPPKPPLTPEQLQRIAGLRAFAAKKEKVAKFLIAEDLANEAEPHRKAAEKALEEAAAIEGSTA